MEAKRIEEAVGKMFLVMDQAKEMKLKAAKQFEVAEESETKAVCNFLRWAESYTEMMDKADVLDLVDRIDKEFEDEMFASTAKTAILSGHAKNLLDNGEKKQAEECMKLVFSMIQEQDLKFICKMIFDN
jgi:hypothetical protein